MAVGRTSQSYRHLLSAFPPPQNVLVEDGELTGVINWTDIAAGDSATDFASICAAAFGQNFAGVRQTSRRGAISGGDDGDS
jgi:aminoglycoside phosphotransferase (APT) family kinase protein